MTIEQIGMGVAAAAIVAWPGVKRAAMSAVAALRGRQGLSVAPVSYEAAIHDLAVVRSRLAYTGLLSDDARKADISKAIDTLTLALVAGSDK